MKMYDPFPFFSQKINGGNIAKEVKSYRQAEQRLEPKSRSWRLRFFNWLVQGRIILKEENKVSTNIYGSAQSAVGPLHTINLTGNSMNLPGISFKITSANGGTIISVKQEHAGYAISGTGSEELYIIPDGVEDFDRELGKIITMYRMKQK
jgi:hypothetical protein